MTTPRPTAASPGVRQPVADGVGFGKTGVPESFKLISHLQFAVPIRIEELRQQPDWALDQLQAALPDRLQQGADAMQFGHAALGEISRNVAAWTTALALLALRAQGGVDADFDGTNLHWCRTRYCRAASRFEHAPDICQHAPDILLTPVSAADEQPLRPIETVPVTGGVL